MATLASPEELHAKLRPSLGPLVDGPAEDGAALPDQLTVLSLVAGLVEADLLMIEQGLGRPASACAPLLTLVHEATCEKIGSTAPQEYQRDRSHQVASCHSKG